MHIVDMEETMDEQSYANNNCLNLIRIVAAFQVLFGHMVEHLELPINDMFLKTSYFLRGVPIFFVISGFLMWFSIARSNSYEQYLKKRFWRILPELWVAVILEIIVIVIVYSGWNLKDLLLFAFGQGTFFQFWTPESLKTYGVGTPNGALWTIGVMMQFYIVVWFFYKLMKNRSIWAWIAGFAISFSISFALGKIIHDLLRIDIIGKLYDQTVIKYFWLFYIGMFISNFKNRFFPILKKYWYAFLLTAFLFFWTGWDLFSGYYLIWSILLTSGLIGFAYKFPQLSISPDISYAVFLYHMTIMNVFVNYNFIGNWLYALAFVILTIVVALISTITVGRWSAKRKMIQLKN